MTTIRILLNNFAHEVMIQGSAMAWNKKQITPEMRNREIKPKLDKLIKDINNVIENYNIRRYGILETD